ncbi:sensor histidine kinase [Novosphingobium sp. Gsoil 351]|uniref:sensor histidine kinase n=1 Tax=Novosphingobium sp. Gsoil 351 TaxID=2675225 RepID=UPI0012B48372|nr:CHASE3 domain-containing protein [Novosphingobium sp. Gsoil 351]QGN54662.1 histidine kinase [Novosphingobium sp. Gsoil 351]
MALETEQQIFARKRLGWRRTAPGMASLALFGLVALSLLAATFLIFSTVRAERAERVQVAQTREVLEALREITTATLNAETGQRGYIITLDRRYLAPFQLGAASYPTAMRRLHALLDPAADARQRALVARVEKLADAKFAEMAETVSLVDDGRIVDAEARLLSDEGQQLMTELRATAGELEAIEAGQLRRAASDTLRLEGRMAPLLAGLLLLILGALVLGLWQVVRGARAEALAATAQDLSAARDRADLLAGELNHRVKNLFAVVLAIVKMSGKGDPAAKPAIDKIAQRLHALLRSHEVTQGDRTRPEIDLRELVDTALEPYRLDESRGRIEGDPVMLRSHLAVPLGLVLHELVTNAVKYGALANGDGKLAVSWRHEGGRVRLIWREEGAKPVAPSGDEGFGSMLIGSSAKQIAGTIERHFHPTGVEVTMDFPVK